MMSRRPVKRTAMSPPSTVKMTSSSMTASPSVVISKVTVIEEKDGIGIGGAGEVTESPGIAETSIAVRLTELRLVLWRMTSRVFVAVMLPNSTGTGETQVVPRYQSAKRSFFVALRSSRTMTVPRANVSEAAEKAVATVPSIGPVGRTGNWGLPGENSRTPSEKAPLSAMTRPRRP